MEGTDIQRGKCFNHPADDAARTCMYCGKDFCSECLLLQGPLEVIACCNCYERSLKRLTSSIKRRKVYLFLGAVLFVAMLAYLFLVLPGPVLSVPLAVMAIAVLGSVIINAISINKMQSALLKKPYSTHREDAE